MTATFEALVASRSAGVIPDPERLAAAITPRTRAIVGFPSDVREVTLGSNGTLAGCKAGNILVDMTTSEPSLAVEIYEAAKAKGVHSVDAPVSGGDIGAKNAALSIMVGGDQNVVDALSISTRGYVIENGATVLEGDARTLLRNEQVRASYLGL